jgi:DNA-binding SARP family transcriptional activator
VEYRILGPLEVVDEGEPVALGRLKERLVLAVLLLHANEFVARERLIDELWGESPPPTARKAVNVYVSQLRKALVRNGCDPITTADGGYRLEVDAERLDTARLQQLIASARERAAAGELEAAAEHLAEALDLWRGPTLAGLLLESHGRDEIAQLDELRLTALMDRIDCDLALGRHEQVLGELNLLVREHPLRERLRGQQMLALYRAERQADALDAYAEARRTLVDDLGIEPSEAMQRLQQAILRHDSSLETPGGTAAVNGLAPSAAAPPSPIADADVSEGPTRRRFRPRRWQLVLACFVILAAAAATAAMLSTSAGATPHIVPNSLVQLNPRTGKPVLVKRVGVFPAPLAVTPTAIWTANSGDNTVSRYDLRTHTVDTRGVSPGQPNDITFDREGNAWITSSNEDGTPAQYSVVTRLQAGPGGTSPGTIYPSHVGPVHVPLPYAGLEALGGDHLWVIVGDHGPVSGDNRVAVIDVRDDQFSVLHLDESATAVAYGYDTAWVGTYGLNVGPTDDSRIEAFRAGHTKPAKIVLDRHGAFWGPVSIAVGDGAVWALTCCEPGRHLLKINPITLHITHRLDLTAEKSDTVVVGAGGVWASSGDGHNITKIDPRTDKIIRTFPFSGKTRTPCVIAATPTTLWATFGGCGTVGL